MHIIYDIKNKIPSELAGFFILTAQPVNCAKLFYKLSALLVTVLLNRCCEIQQYPVISCMKTAYETVYCVWRRIWQFLWLIHHDVSSDWAWWLSYHEPCMSCQSPASVGLGSPGDRYSRSGHVANTHRRRLITCCCLWPTARCFWSDLHLFTRQSEPSLKLLHIALKRASDVHIDTYYCNQNS